MKQRVFLKERTYSDTDLWRLSVYERSDGSVFYVACPGLRPSGLYFPIQYDEAVEAEAVLRLGRLTRTEEPPT